MKTTLWVVGATAFLTVKLNAGIFNVLHSFGTPLGNTGIQPAGGFVADANGTLYGTTFQGGLENYGTVYSENTNGSFALWNFTGGNGGGYPVGDLFLSGNTLYGVTSLGGGSVFKIQTDGTGFSVLYTFTNGTDGGGPAGGLVLSGNALYGVTANYGAGGSGTLFKLNTDGTGFLVFHAFTARDANAFTNTDGAFPHGKLVVSGNVLFGSTAQGGYNDYGTVFAVQTDGGAFTNLHNFAVGEGLSPRAGLTLSENELFGTTSGGGADGNGAIFSLSTDGSGFATLYSLANGGDDGSYPAAPLLVVGSTIYGTASSGGANGSGTIFSLQSDGTDFIVLHPFSAMDPNDGDNADGATPVGGLLWWDGVLYGTASAGGLAAANVSDVEDCGTTFQINPDGSGFAVDDYFYNVSSANDGIGPACPLVMAGNTAYGMAYQGGINGAGCIFKINRDGTGFGLLHSFDFADGAYPIGGLALAGSTLYGTTSSGGAFATKGVVFSMNTDGSGYNVLHSFADGSEGFVPSAGVVMGSNALYGTTYSGGTNGVGTIFSLDLNSLQLTTLLHFAVTNGEHPSAPLLLVGNTLYGETARGGTGAGNLFKIQTDGSSFDNLRVFSFTSGLGAAGEGESPEGGLILSGNTLYGTTQNGGENHTGNIFKINSDGSGYSTLFNFDLTSYNGLTQTNVYGANPQAGLCLAGNTLYGTAANGGGQGYGTLFAVTTNATDFVGFTTLHSFTDGTGYLNPLDGGYPGGGAILSDGELLGVAAGGGTYAQGVLFGYFLLPPMQITTVSNAPFVYWPNDGQYHTLQMATNLVSGSWMDAPGLNYTNVDNNAGLLVTNRPAKPAAFYRLKQ